MKENEEYVVDVLVKLEGQNGAFYSSMNYSEAVEIQQNGGLSCVDKVTLKETSERPISSLLKQGLACIEDIYVSVEPNTVYCLN